MSITNTKINTAAQSIYTSVGEHAIVVAYFCNTSVAPVNFSVYAVAQGNIASPDNLIYSNVSLTSNDTYVMDNEKLILSDGEGLWAVATEDDVIVVTIFDVEV